MCVDVYAGVDETNTHKHVFVGIHTQVYVYIHIHIHPYTYVYIYTYTHDHRVRVTVHTCIDMRVCVCSCIYMNTYTSLRSSVCEKNAHPIFCMQPCSRAPAPPTSMLESTVALTMTGVSVFFAAGAKLKNPFNIEVGG